ncbi:hypothetical protein TNCV_2805291 [Trichonephila clavipes]|nr:hypothetical protein TNCV_2805291 [Trichonephila clavipes]
MIDDVSLLVVTSQISALALYLGGAGSTVVDESKFNLFGCDGKIIVHRKCDAELEERNMVSPLSMEEFSSVLYSDNTVNLETWPTPYAVMEEFLKLGCNVQQVIALCICRFDHRLLLKQKLMKIESVEEGSTEEYPFQRYRALGAG